MVTDYTVMGIVVIYCNRSCRSIYLTKCLWWRAAAATLMPHPIRSIGNQLLSQTLQSETTLMCRHAKDRLGMLSASCRLVSYL